ncbi:MAG: thymidine phosphorylase [Bacteroidota bacterium]|nr:thymidine phosphorylase [Bacteroidota bacterium]MDP4191939.1 thymidine phosphorylase [Bacteroidota bacterium]MDP4196910.1 thymidine phosphorylase [Bacteroidota bacterium]
MNTVELIRKKRNKETLSGEEIKFLINSYIKKKIPDYQFSAFLMAVYFNGMSTEETAALTHAMLYSGKVIDLSSIDGFKIDKHSTGGVGDKTSLILAPIVAAAGINVPMISGRGLGHTGGTLDKLESIPGFRTDLNLARYKAVVKKCGSVLIGQTKEIAPADKLIYALRDVTSTVESIPLITSSIMSKKLAEGIDGLVLDIKTGSGAFMSELKDARLLAEALIGTAKAFGKKVIGFITDMNQPLGNYIGNWLEVYESVKCLQGESVEDLMTVTYHLSGAMIYLGKKAKSIEEGIEISREMVKSGKAFDKFLEIVKLQGGDISYLKNPEKYPKSKVVEKVLADKSGYFSAVDNFALGMASLELGAGRMTKEDTIDPKAGIIFNIKIGDKVNKGDIIAEIHTDRKGKVKEVVDKINSIIELRDKKPSKPKLIKQTLV